jgi:hypothetical protein
MREVVATEAKSKLVSQAKLHHRRVTHLWDSTLSCELNCKVTKYVNQSFFFSLSVDPVKRRFHCFFFVWNSISMNFKWFFLTSTRDARY